MILYSCKEPDQIGLEQIKGEKLGVDIIDIPGIIPGTKDSIYLLAHSVKEESVKTNKLTLNLLGSILDPVFGSTTASIYTQIQLSTNNVNLGNAPGLDSLVLRLAYKSYYGDITTSQNVNVYELSSGLSTDSTYYSYNDNTKNNKAAHYSTIIGSKTNFVPRPNDTVKVNGVKIEPHLRITITDLEFIKKIFEASGTSNLANNANFVNFIKGLYITADPVSSNGAIMYFDMYSAITGLTLYYNNTINDTVKHSSYNFTINSNCVIFNSYNHDYSASTQPQFLKQLINSPQDTILGNQALYLQAMGGVKTKILFPGIMKLKNNGNIAINKAELIIRANLTDPTNATYTSPPQLVLLRSTSSGTLILPPDILQGANYFGGIYDSQKKEYRFRLTFYIQDLLNGNIKGDKGLYLSVDGASYNAQRIVLNGIKPTETSRNLKLQITYTNLTN